MNAKSCVEFVLQAMNNVDDEYLNVKIAVDYVGHKEVKRRERVYAYELYHQMRLIQEQKFKSEFTINGEIDKSGHKIIKEPFNPDFVIHQQGKMGENFCVVELKTINKKSGIQKDFHTITCMMHCYRYKIGIFAIAGVLLSDIKSILVEVWNTQEHLQEHGEKIYVIAYHNIGKIGEVVDRPKALGDIRGVSYIYGLFYRFGLIDVPDKVKEKMGGKEH